MRKINNGDQEPKPQVSYRNKVSNRNVDFGGSQRAIFLDRIPEYFNEAVKRTEARLGPFIVDSS